MNNLKNKISASSARRALPASAPCVLLQRKKKPVSIQFQLKVDSKFCPNREPHSIQYAIAKASGQPVSESAVLQLRITVQGFRDSGFVLRMPEIPIGSLRNSLSPINNYGAILTIDPALWDQKNSCLIGRSEEVSAFNNELLRIKLKIREIYSLQLERFIQKIGPSPTTENVKREYLTGEKTLTERGRLVQRNASIVGGFDTYYQHLLSQQDTELALSEASLYKRRHTRANLVDFLVYEETPNLEAKQINQRWAKRFYNWLMQDGRMLPCSARMEVGVIRMALAYLVELDQLRVNPLIGLILPKGKKKPVVWLSPEQVEALWQINAYEAKRGNEVSIEAAESALFWFKVIVLTGMDYLDAVRYVGNRSAYDCVGIGGRKIVINRGKNGSECHIPVTGKLEELLAGPIPRVYGIDHVNNALTLIGKSIGFAHSLTTKVGRKTAGAIWMLEGYTIHEISRFLGHSSIAMTESHYVKTSGITADRGMLRMQEKHQGSQQSNCNPFSYTYKAS